MEKQVLSRSLVVKYLDDRRLGVLKLFRKGLVDAMIHSKFMGEKYLVSLDLRCWSERRIVIKEWVLKSW